MRARQEDNDLPNEVEFSADCLCNPDTTLYPLGKPPDFEAAEEFAKGDLFVLNGKVIRWYIREWNNMLA